MQLALLLMVFLASTEGISIGSSQGSRIGGGQAVDASTNSDQLSRRSSRKLAQNLLGNIGNIGNTANGIGNTANGLVSDVCTFTGVCSPPPGSPPLQTPRPPPSPSPPASPPPPSPPPPSPPPTPAPTPPPIVTTPPPVQSPPPAPITTPRGSPPPVPATPPPNVPPPSPIPPTPTPSPQSPPPAPTPVPSPPPTPQPTETVVPSPQPELASPIPSPEPLPSPVLEGEAPSPGTANTSAEPPPNAISPDIQPAPSPPAGPPEAESPSLAESQVTPASTPSASPSETQSENITQTQSPAAESPSQDMVPPEPEPPVSSTATNMSQAPEPSLGTLPQESSQPSASPETGNVQSNASIPSESPNSEESSSESPSPAQSPPEPSFEAPTPLSTEPSVTPAPAPAIVAVASGPAPSTPAGQAVGTTSSGTSSGQKSSSSSAGAIAGGVAGGVGAILAAGGLTYYCRRKGKGKDSDESSSRKEAHERNRAEWAANHAQNRAEWKERMAKNRADTKETVRNSREFWKSTKAGKSGNSIGSAYRDEKGLMAGTTPAGPTDLEKLVGGQNKGVAQLQSFAAMDSAMFSANGNPSNQSVGYDLLGSQNIEVVGSETSGRPVIVPVQDSAENYENDRIARGEVPNMAEDSWQLNAEDITICKTDQGEDIMIGQGGFGSVYLGELFSSTQVAIKVLKSSDARSREAFLNEMSILKSLHHGNIVQFLGACVLQKTVALVTEFMPSGDLWHALSSDHETREFSYYKTGRSLAIDIARGTIYMHSKKIIHLDLKSANILLSRDGSAKIADVGLAKIMSRELTQVSARGSFDWVAPEVLRGDEVNDRADMWSLAVLLWEICSGERPQNRFIRELRVPEECPREISELIAQCRMDPEDRPSAKEFYDTLINAPQTLEEASQRPKPVASRDETNGPATTNSSREAYSIDPRSQTNRSFDPRSQSGLSSSREAYSVNPRSHSRSPSRREALPMDPNSSTQRTPLRPGLHEPSPRSYGSIVPSQRSSQKSSIRAPRSQSYFASREPSNAFTGHDSPWTEGSINQRGNRRSPPPLSDPFSSMHLSGRFEGPSSTSIPSSNRYEVPQIPPFRGEAPHSRRSTRSSGPPRSSRKASRRQQDSMSISPFLRVETGAAHDSQASGNPHLSSSRLDSDATQQSRFSKGKKASPFAASQNQEQPLSSFWDSRSSWQSRGRE